MTYTFDSRAVKPGMGFVALRGEKVDGHAFIPQALEAGAAEIVDGLDALQAKARDYRRSLKAKVIGVTGSAGKTTTKEVLKAFFAQLGKTYGTEGNFNNHIGLPMTILNCPSDAEFLVLEMGTNHPGEIAALCDIAEPDVGVLVSVGTAHLEFFKTRAGIAAEKGTLLERAKDFGVFPAACDFAADLAGRCRVAVAAELDTWGGVLVGHEHYGEEVAWPPHFENNVAVAFACAAKFGLTLEQARAALRGFALPGARWRRCEKGGVSFIDDSYNANPDSMIAALDAFVKIPAEGRHVAILGDMGELGEDSRALHQKVFDHARALGLDLVIGVGRSARDSRAPSEAGVRVSHAHYGEVASLKRDLFAVLRPGDLVLLKASHSMHLSSLLEDK